MDDRVRTTKATGAAESPNPTEALGAVEVSRVIKEPHIKESHVTGASSATGAIGVGRAAGTSVVARSVEAAGARSVLFVPGSRPDRFASAHRAEPGLVVIDLEDAVGEADKDAAREAADRWLSEGHRCGVRINAVGTPWHEADLAMVARHDLVVMVPKAQDPEALAGLARELTPGSGVIALVETARGVLEAPRTAEVAGVVRLAFGSLDLAAELGVAPDRDEVLQPARAALVLASAAAGLAPPLDDVTTDVRNTALLASDVRTARDRGLGGKLCVHPAQVPTTEAGFAPTEEETVWARRILDAVGDAAVASVDGRMVDRPVIERARRLLADSRSPNDTRPEHRKRNP